MDGHLRDQVCLLIDFENMVKGLASLVGEDRLPDTLDVGILFGLAEEYGRVVVARAYADWRMKEMNQFQFDLYNQGVDLIHVLGKRQKNAVDVKLAVDAVEAIWEMPDIRTFVLVSGDRDFIHVLKALRRHGKTVIGVAPDNAVSEDFAALCDRFVAYSALRDVQAEQIPEIGEADSLPPLREVGRTLGKLLQRCPEGIKGAQIIPALRREISPTFDVSSYGFAKLGEMLGALPDVAEVRTTHGGDILVLPKRGAQQSVLNQDQVAALVDAAGLNNYRFLVSMEQRRRVLSEIHRAMVGKQAFTWNKILEQVLEETRDSKLTISVLSKYHSMLWQSRAFAILPDQQTLPVKERRMVLAEGRRSYAGFVAYYEHSAVFKVRQVKRELTPEQVVGLLGLEADGANALPYCRALLLDVQEFNELELVVPGIGQGPDPVFVRRLESLFQQRGQKHSRGSLINQLRQMYANAATQIDHTSANRMFDDCLKHGVIDETTDGAVRVYRLGADT